MSLLSDCGVKMGRGRGGLHLLQRLLQHFHGEQVHWLLQKRVRNLLRNCIANDTGCAIISNLSPSLPLAVAPLLEHQSTGKRRPFVQQRRAVTATQPQRGHERQDRDVVPKHDVEQSVAAAAAWVAACLFGQ